MRKLICVVCGRPATAESLCEEHYTRKHELFDAKSLLVHVCDGCGSVFDQKWKRVPLEDALREIIGQSVKVHGKLENIDVDLKKIGNNYIATIKVSGSIPPAATVKTETKKIDVRIRNIKCPSCVKLLGRYHEAVIQVRGDRAERLIELAGEIANEMSKRMEHIKEGWNIYFVHKSNARTVISELDIILTRAHEPNVEVIRSHKVAGQKDGRNLMRDFYAVR
jgi:NMD protein affecting ribosome stability and mRNA decay